MAPLVPSLAGFVASAAMDDDLSSPDHQAEPRETL